MDTAARTRDIDGAGDLSNNAIVAPLCAEGGGIADAMQRANHRRERTAHLMVPTAVSKV